MKSIALPDGRRLAYAEYGAADGEPVLHFHGVPGSRLQMHPDTSIPRERGARLILPDRPGMGHSDFQRHRTLLDWPADVAALADALGLQRFHLIGVSGGAPYALACAHRLADRVRRVAIVSGMGPMTLAGASQGMLPGMRLVLWLAPRAPWLLGLPFRIIASRVQTRPNWRLKRLAVPVPEADERIMARPEIQRALQMDFAEALRQGLDGVRRDTAILGDAWGFDLCDITRRVDLWHGDADTIVPIHMGRAVAERLPDAQPRWVRGEGHYLVMERLGEILDVLLENPT